MLKTAVRGSTGRATQRIIVGAALGGIAGSVLLAAPPAVAAPCKAAGKDSANCAMDYYRTIPGSRGNAGSSGGGGTGEMPEINVPELGGVFVAPDQPPPAPVPEIPTIVIAEKARSELTVPAPGIHTSPSPKTYVRVKTGLWVDPNTYNPITITTTAGNKSVRATARPAGVTWNLGEKTIECAGPGSKNGTTCSYTYQRSSAGRPGNVYQISATVNWTVTWACVSGCTESGTLDPMPMTSTNALAVGEIQTNSRPR